MADLKTPLALVLALGLGSAALAQDATAPAETPAEAPAAETPAAEAPAAEAPAATEAETSDIGKPYVAQTFDAWTVQCIRTEDGKVDMKKRGIAPIAAAARVYGLEAGTRVRPTRERLEAAMEAGVISRDLVGSTATLEVISETSSQEVFDGLTTRGIGVEFEVKGFSGNRIEIRFKDGDGGVR